MFDRWLASWACSTLEGSIRREGDLVRIAAQLIDAMTGGHRWADRYDRKLDHIFAIQDEVARNVAAGLAAHVIAIELNPNSSDWRVPGILIFVGQAERAVDVAKTNLRIDPFAPPIARGYLGLAHLTLRRYSEAIPPLQEFVARAPKQRLGHVW